MNKSHAWKKTAIDHFKQWADHYDRGIINTLLFNPTYRRVVSQWRHWQRLQRPVARILDIGCGTGTLAIRHLSQLVGIQNITGLDMSAHMIAVAEEKVRQFDMTHLVRFTIGDSEHLPFADNSFDLITCCNSFHHYPHQQLAVSEMHRVLAPGGHVMIVDGSREEPWGYFIFEICVARVEKHVYHCTAKRFHTLLTRAGFADIQQKTVNVCPPILLNTATAIK